MRKLAVFAVFCLVLLASAQQQPRSRSYSYSSGDDQQENAENQSDETQGESQEQGGRRSFAYSRGGQRSQGQPIVVRRTTEQMEIPQEEESEQGYGSEEQYGRGSQQYGPSQEEEGYGSEYEQMPIQRTPQWQVQPEEEEMPQGSRRPFSTSERIQRAFANPEDCYPFHDQMRGENPARMQRPQQQPQQQQQPQCPPVRFMQLQPPMRCLPPSRQMSPQNMQQQQPTQLQQIQMQCRQRLANNRGSCFVGPHAQFFYPPPFVQSCLPTPEQWRQANWNRLPPRRRMTPMRPIRTQLPPQMGGQQIEGDECFPGVGQQAQAQPPPQMREDMTQRYPDEQQQFEQEQYDQMPGDEQGYDQGQGEGYDQGSDQGEQQGYDQGYDQGSEEQTPAEEQPQGETDEQSALRARALAFLRRERARLY